MLIPVLPSLRHWLLLPKNKDKRNARSQTERAFLLSLFPTRQERVFFSKVLKNKLFIAGHGLADIGILFVDRAHFPQRIAMNPVKRHIVLAADIAGRGDGTGKAACYNLQQGADAA